jgi:hypothetical protein
MSKQVYYNPATGEFDIPELRFEGDEEKCLKVYNPEAYAEEGCCGCGNMNGCVPFQ